ncbi:glycosyltransferase family 4 protein [Flavobacterium terrisoli]|uniref:glycosyltransferase family 4 protein n=1 Tax=Flavobacterium terrisoli TaxID=3242195 RepID=UPI002542CAB6|nr:glycosyltransferase family 4 protein [Flavobacterium buctense]
MKVLYLTKYTRKGASSRMRSYQFFPNLEQHGMQITVRPLFNDEYLTQLYNEEKISKGNLLKCYLKRFFVLFSVLKYDKIVVEKELFPYLPAWPEIILSKIKGYIADYDDAIFHNYDLSTNRVIRFFLKRKIDVVMKNSQLVVAGNEYLADRAKSAGAQNIIRIPTVIDLDRYSVKNDYSSDQIKIGWIGSPSTLWHLKPFTDLFNELVALHNVKIIIIGATEKFGVTHNIEYINWSEESEVAEMLKFDIGIMPLTETPWVMGKCSFKLIQYMGCALPVVASPVSMNNEVVDVGVNGFLATTPEEWKVALEKLIFDESLRKRFGQAGRKKVEEIYNLETNSGKIIKILASD